MLAFFDSEMEYIFCFVIQFKKLWERLVTNYKSQLTDK